MFLGCSPCCSICPNYYQILDNADLIELHVYLTYLDGNVDENTGSGSFQTMFDDFTNIGPSANVILPGGANDLGGNVLLRPQSKSATNGVVSFRAYDPSGWASPGVLSNYFEVSATSYALSIGAHVRESNCWHDYIIREEKCVFPDVAWSSTHDFGNFDAKAEHDTAFSTGNGQSYKTKKGPCQRLNFYNYSRYADLPFRMRTVNGVSRKVLFNIHSYQPLDWSFIFPIVDSHDYNAWVSSVDMGGTANYPQTGTPYHALYKDLNGNYTSTASNPDGTNPAYNLRQMICVRPWEDKCFSDVYGTQQNRELTKKMYDDVPANGAQRGQQETLLIQAAWAWKNGERTSLMQTQPSYGSKDLAWQLHFENAAAIATTDWSYANVSYDSPIRSYKTNRNFYEANLHSVPNPPFWAGSSATVCEQMGEPYGW
jgi:hypothetical protein